MTNLNMDTIFLGTNNENSDLLESPIQTSSYQSNDLNNVSNCLDNLCIISQFCTITSLDQYVDFMIEHLN